MKKLLLIACGIVGATNVYADISALSYVTNGLVAHWDGLENAGYGAAHDSSATTWTDLRGGTTGIAIDSTWSWAANGLVTTRAKGCQLAGSQNNVINLAYRSGQFSCEVAYDQTGTTTASSLGYGNKVAYLFAFNGAGYWMGLSSDRYAGFNPNGANRAPGFATTSQGAACAYDVTSTLGKHTLSCVQDNKNFWDYFDSNAAFTGTITKDLKTAYDTPVEFNRQYSAYDDSGLNGIYHAVRVYNRPLTEDEVALNHAIDSIRFFGADPASVTLPAGYRINNNKLEKKISYSATGGTVTVGGESYAWMEQNGSETVALVATPESGYEFVRWDGIERVKYAKVLDAEITVNFYEAERAVPVFRKANAVKLSAKSYIKEGLLNLWDGLENAGYGTHSDSPTVWTDLVGGHNLTLPNAQYLTTVYNGFEGAKWSTINQNMVDGIREGTVTSWDVGNGKLSGKAAAARHQTFECAYYQDELIPSAESANGRSFVGMLWFGHEGYCFGLMWNNSFRFDTHEQGQNATMNWGYDSDTTLGQRSFSCAQQNENWWIRVDGTAGSSGTIKSTYASVFDVGSRSGTGFNMKYPYDSTTTWRKSFNGTYHCMRFYNRALSLEEVQVNRIIDCIRYFGGMPADYTLPEGWRFAVGDDIQIERKAELAPVVGGTYTYGGAAVESATEGWVTQGEGTEIALTAMPASGYEFSHWEGVAEDDMFTQSGTLTVLGGEVKPVFRLPEAGGEGLYKGLVYDMALDLENAENIYNAVENMKLGTRTYAEKVGDVAFNKTDEFSVRGSYTTKYAQPNLKFTNVISDDQTQMKRPGMRIANWSVDGDVTVRVRFKWEGAAFTDRLLYIPIFTSGFNAGAARGFSIGMTGSKNYRYDYLYLKLGGDHHSSNLNTSLLAYRLFEPGVSLDVVVAMRKISGSMLEVNARVMVIGDNTDQCYYKTSTVKMPIADVLTPLSGGGFMQLGTDSATSIGDADYQTELNGFAGNILGCQVWNRALSEAELQTLHSGATGAKWTIGSRNESSDEFATVGGDEAEETYKPYEMPWRKMPKALTAAKPSFTLSGVLNPTADKVVEEGMVKFITIYPVTESLPTTAKLLVKVNNNAVGVLNLEAGERTVYLRRSMMKPDKDGNINLTIVRDESSTGDIEIDAIEFGGGERYGKVDLKTSEFNLYAANGFEALGATNSAWVHNRIRNTDGNRELVYNFSVPAKVAEESGFHFKTVVRYSGSYMFDVYLNGTKVYTTPADLTDCDIVSIDVPKGCLKAGMNTLKICRQEEGSTNYVEFDYLKFDFDAPSLGVIILFK